MEKQSVEIVHEDRERLVCVKPVGMASQADGSGASPVTALQTQLGGTIYPVHRLDRAVGGLIAYARTKQEAARLSAAVQQRMLEKEYLCVVNGCPEAPAGMLRDLLFKDSAKNKSYVVKRPRKGVKEAVLDHRVLASAETERGLCSLVHVHLQTGRTHQIRVQFSSRGLPLVGDGKYGGRDNGLEIALWSCRLTIPLRAGEAPLTVFCRPPETEPWRWFQGAIYDLA